MDKNQIVKYFADNRISNAWHSDLTVVLQKTENEIHGAAMFYAINKTLPNTLHIEDFEAGPYFDKFIQEMKIDLSFMIKSEYFDVGRNELGPQHFNLLLTKDLFIKYKPNSYSAILYYSNALDQNVLDYFKKSTKEFAVKNVIENSLFLLTEQGGKLATYRTSPPKAFKVDIELAYNDDFHKVNDIILSKLSMENGKGIVLLHGVPGTGKSSYIRYLIGKIKKRVIYVPADYAYYLGSKEFMQLLLEHRDSILIVEDAEDVIKSRGNSSVSATANLLNLGDGLLSDTLGIQIILTFNTELAKIDSALLRKGRVLARYEFKPLTMEKSQKLSDSLGFKTRIEKEMTLAEIYNQEDFDFADPKRKVIGFRIDETTE